MLGVIGRDQLAAIVESGRGKEVVGALGDETVVHAHPDHPIDIVMERFAESPGILPILSREQTRRIEGVITLEDITRYLQRRRVERRRTASPPE